MPKAAKKPARKPTQNPPATPPDTAAPPDAPPPDLLDSMLAELGADDDALEVSVHRFTRDGAREFCAVYPLGEFSPESLKDQWGGGRYQLVIRAVQGKQYRKQAQLRIAGEPKTPASHPHPGPIVAQIPVAPAAPAPQAQALDHLLNFMAEQNKALLAAVSAKPAAQGADGISLRDVMRIMERRGSLAETIEAMELLERRFKRPEEHSQAADAPLSDALISKIMEKLLDQPPANPAPAPAAQPGPALPPPPANPTEALGAVLLRIVPILAAGAATNGDPQTYAEVIDDAMCAAGLGDLAESLALSAEPGTLTKALTARAPQLAQAGQWLAQVEAALIERFKTEPTKEPTP